MIHMNHSIESSINCISDILNDEQHSFLNHIYKLYTARTDLELINIVKLFLNYINIDLCEITNEIIEICYQIMSPNTEIDHLTILKFMIKLAYINYIYI